jgi:tRNA-dihydrouridine synthase B
MTFKENFSLGKLLLPHNIIFAPLAEYTDFPFRRFIRKYHKGLIFCEMVKMEALIRDKCEGILKYLPSMHPIGAQLCGANPVVAAEAAKIIEDKGFDVIDLNCGCPVHKVVKDGSGSALLKTPSTIYKVLKEITSSVSIPVTVKVRLGWDDNSICASEIVKIAIDAGCSAITIHGRTKKQMYSGKADWEAIAACKAEYPGFTIFANGDIYTPEDVKNALEKTLCDGVMIARGMLKNPNITEEIIGIFSKCKKNELDKKEALLEYIEYSIEEKGKVKALYDIRKMCGWILRGSENIKYLRIAVNEAASINEAKKHLMDFIW